MCRTRALEIPCRLLLTERIALVLVHPVCHPGIQALGNSSRNAPLDLSEIPMEPDFCGFRGQHEYPAWLAGWLGILDLALVHHDSLFSPANPAQKRH